MPLKKIGKLNNGTGLKTTYTLSTSSFFNETLSKSFNIEIGSILTVGLPRNERLFPDKNQVKNYLRIKNYSTVVFWLPTYRKSNTGEIREDGTIFNNPFNLPDFNQRMMNDFFLSNNIICFFKVHPMADLGDFKSSSNLILIDDEYLYNRNLTLYNALAISDLLITDISSVVIDYMLLDKPIILSFADKEAYINTRGLNSTELLETPPGKICVSQNEITHEIYLLINGIDNYKGNRRDLKHLYHNYTDYFNCSDNLIKILGIN